MALCKQISCFKFLGTILEKSIRGRCLHTAPVHQSVATWRYKKGLPAKGAEYGPVTDLPDWSYSDGQPAPLPTAKKNRIELHKDYCEQIIKLTAEVDQCVDLSCQKALKEEEMRQNSVTNRLKEKGESFS